MPVPEKLSERHELVALLDAKGVNNTEIARLLGFAREYISVIKRHPHYQILLQRFKGELQEKVLDRTADLLAAFNEESMNAFGTLKDIHRDSDQKGSTRVAAAEAILDRSAWAPRKRGDQVDQRGTVIVLGVKTVNNMRSALDDIEDRETVDLIEDEYELVEDSGVYSIKEVE